MTCVIGGSSVKDHNIFDSVSNISQMREFKDRYKDNEENPCLYTRQFSPFVVDKINPMSFSLKVMNDLSWGADAGGRVQMKFLDPSGIDYVKIKNRDQGNYKKILFRF